LTMSSTCKKTKLPGFLHSHSFWLAFFILLIYFTYIYLQSIARVNWLPSMELWPLTHVAAEATLFMATIVISSNKFGFKWGLLATLLMWGIMSFHELRYAERQDTWLMLVVILGFGIAASWFVSQNKRFMTDQAQLIRIQVQTHEQLKQQTDILTERLKELHCLYNISSLTDKPGILMDELIHQTVLQLSRALKYPEAACVKVILEDKEYKSPGWQPPFNLESFDIVVHTQKLGLLEIGYKLEDPGNSGRVFLPEEREMCSNASMQLSGFIDRIRDDQQLEGYRQHLEQLVVERTSQLENALEVEKALREQLESQIKQRIEFTRAIVHELKTPLTALVAASDLLTIKCEPFAAKKLARQVNKGALDLNKRINELFDLARGEIGMLKLRCQNISAGQLLHDVFSYFAAEAEKKQLKMVQAWPQDLPGIFIDVQRITQVLYNLLQNAIEHTSAGGSITLRAVRQDDELIITIEDTGCGIPSGKAKALFQSQSIIPDADNTSGGMGIGLAISKMLVELHGGRIWVESQVNAGSAFGFALSLNPGDRLEVETL
jgi:signal transduction histidine kinase